MYLDNAAQSLTGNTGMRNLVYSPATESGDRKHDFLHLTQVSQQIRGEFRPIYMNETRTIMSGRELTAYLYVFHSQWAGTDVSGDKTSPLMVITRCLPRCFSEHRYSPIFPWSYDSVNLLPEILPEQRADIIRLCRAKVKAALGSMNFTSFASGRICCEITDRSTIYYCHLAYNSDMVVKERHVMTV